jgi:uncharacterized membrane protein required for colicin V production
MILSSVLIVLLLGIAFIHYIQGMFSATLSAILAIIAAAVALGFTEPVLAMLKPAKTADIATAGVLCGLFIVTYLILRVIFDKAIPGNMRLEPTVDKIGAAVMGLIAGVICTGIIAIATASMPFSSSLGGMYSRYALEADKEVSGAFKPQQGQSTVFTIFNPTKDAAFLPNDKDSSGNVNPNLNKLMIPVDDWTLGLVSSLSSGSLAGDRKFSDIHPDYLQELYGQRTGIQPGARHAAPTFPGSEAVQVQGIYILPSLPAVKDAELPVILKGGFDQLAPPQKGTPLLVIRAHINASAGDDNSGNLDFSPAAVRLVVHRTDKSTSAVTPTDIYPIGTYEDGKLWTNRMDDFLFAHGDSTIDFVFSLEGPDPTDITTDAKPDKGIYKVQDGTLFEFKRLGMVDLSGQDVTVGFPPASTGGGVMRKELLKPKPQNN